MTNTLGKLRNALGREFTKAAMFEYSTVSSLASLAATVTPKRPPPRWEPIGRSLDGLR